MFLGLFCYKFMSKYLEMKIFNYLKKIKNIKNVDLTINDINELLLLLLFSIFMVLFKWWSLVKKKIMFWI